MTTIGETDVVAYMEMNEDFTCHACIQQAVADNQYDPPGPRGLTAQELTEWLTAYGSLTEDVVCQRCRVVLRRGVPPMHFVQPGAGPQCSEPTLTRIEHAERTTVFMDYAAVNSDDPVRVAVAAQKAARALDLALKGFCVELVEHGGIVPAEPEAADVLSELAAGVALLCAQMKRLVATSPGAEPWTSPAVEGGSR